MGWTSGRASYTARPTSPGPPCSCWAAKAQGLHQLVKKHCDVLVRIPMAGAISSLNVSVAAGIVLFEWRRTDSKSR